MAREGRFLPRADVEPDRSWKQVIPYLVLRDGSRYFLMRRTRAGGDARLHDLWSIGVGGHLNPGDGDLAGGLRREWREEIEADFEPEFRLIGLLNDDTTDVGSVHLGAVYVGGRGGSRRGDPRDRQAVRRLRRAGRGCRGRRSDGDVERSGVRAPRGQDTGRPKRVRQRRPASSIKSPASGPRVGPAAALPFIGPEFGDF